MAVESFISPASNESCCPIGCGTYEASVRSRNPKTGEFSSFQVDIPKPTGRIYRELSRVGFAELDFGLQECKALFDALREAGRADEIVEFGEWGHELSVTRTCEPGRTVFDGPIVGSISDSDGSYTMIAADRAAWWGEGWLETDITGGLRPAGAVLAELIRRYRSSWNDDGTNIDLAAMSECGDMISPDFFGSDCLPFLDHIEEIGDLWVPWVHVGDRFYYGCPDMGLEPLRIGRQDWESGHVPEFRDGYQLATVVKAVAEPAEDADLGSVGVYPDVASGIDDCDVFYGRHGHVVQLPFAADQVTVDQAAKRAYGLRRRTPRLLGGTSGFSGFARVCVSDLVPGRRALVEGAGHWQTDGTLVEQTLGTVDIRFEGGCETDVIPGFFGSGFGNG